MDNRYTNVIKLLLKDRTAIVVGPSAGLLETLEHCMELIELINAGVSQYLEKKRLVFPRYVML